MIIPVTTRELLHQVRQLAQRTRAELVQAHLLPEDLRGIARHYGLTLGWGDLPAHAAGLLPRGRAADSAQSARAGARAAPFHLLPRAVAPPH